MKLSKRLLGIVKFLLGVGVFVFVIDKFSYAGAFGLLIIIGLIIGRRVWKNRVVLMEGIRNIETLMWGKPLDKGTWKKGELKKKWKRTKFVWKKEGEKISISFKPLLMMLFWAALFIVAYLLLR